MSVTYRPINAKFGMNKQTHTHPDHATYIANLD